LPFWAAGEAYCSRGRAYAAQGDKVKAVADLKSALDFTGDKRAKEDIRRAVEDLTR
jgi:hypothetical protein